MSYLNLKRSAIKQNEHVDSNSNEQKNLNTSINMDLVEEKEAIRQGEKVKNESKSFMCLDVENSIDPPSDRNVMDLGIGQLIDVTERRTNIWNQKGGRWKFNVLGLYDVFRSPQQHSYPPQQPQTYPPQQPQTYPPQQQQTYPPQQYIQQQQNRPYFTRQLWRQEQPPPQPQQTMWTQYNQGRGQGYGGYGEYDGYGTAPLEYDPRSRNSFVALVMAIVFVMLLSTAGFIAFVLLMPDVLEFFQMSGWVVMLPAMFGLIAVNYAMMCSPCARRPPCNIVMIIITTLCMSCIAAKISSHFRTEMILYAVLATGAAVFVCVCLACTKFDFTSWLLYVVVISTGFAVIVIIILLVSVMTGSFMKPIIIIILVVGTIIQIVMELTDKNRKGLYEIVNCYYSEHDSD